MRTLLFITLDTLGRDFTIYRQTETVCRFEILSRFEGAPRDALTQPSFGGMTTDHPTAPVNITVDSALSVEIKHFELGSARPKLRCRMGKLLYRAISTAGTPHQSAIFFRAQGEERRLSQSRSC